MKYNIWHLYKDTIQRTNRYNIETLLCCYGHIAGCLAAASVGRVCARVFSVWGGGWRVGGANLSGATLKKQSRRPVNLDEPDRGCLAAPWWKTPLDLPRALTPMRPERPLAAACRDADAHDFSHPLLLWRAREERTGCTRRQWDW